MLSAENLPSMQTVNQKTPENYDLHTSVVDKPNFLSKFWYFSPFSTKTNLAFTIELLTEALLMSTLTCFWREIIKMITEINIPTYIRCNGLLQTTLFVPTLDTATQFVVMTICLSRNLHLRGNNKSQIMQEYCI